MAKTPEELYVDLCKAQLAGFPREVHAEWAPSSYGVLDGNIFAPPKMALDDDGDDKTDRIDDALIRLNYLLDDLRARVPGTIFDEVVDEDGPMPPGSAPQD